MRGWVTSLALLGYLAASVAGNEVSLVCCQVHILQKALLTSVTETG